MTNTNFNFVKISGIGRRKTAIASIELLKRNQTDSVLIPVLQVNGREGDNYFQYNLSYLNKIQAPLKKLDLVNTYRIVVKVNGGGLTAQAAAIQLGVARALANLDPITYRIPLKQEGFLSRDARIKERRKYGLKKARKASQSSKR